MAGVCCVTGCTVEPATDVYYFPLPTKPALRRRWIDVIKPSSKLGRDASVCSEHFSRDDYESVRGRTRLKRGRVPRAGGELKSDTEDDGNHSDESTGTKSKSQAENEEEEERAKEMEVEENGVAVGEKETDIEQRSESNGLRDDYDPNCIEIQITPDIIEDYNSLQVTPDIIEGDNTLKPPDPLDPDMNHDIEDILTNYHIMNPPDRRDRESKTATSDKTEDNNKTVSDKTADTKKTEEFGTRKSTDQPSKSSEPATSTENAGETATEDIQTIDDDDDDLPLGVAAKPVFIEINVDKDRRTSAEGGDCLMVLESLQCNIDPSALMLEPVAEPDPVAEIEIPDNSDDEKPHDPISLLTSSDEDEVIIQEPHIDTVEVSDETDEDDVPLVKLVKPGIKPGDLSKLFWGSYDYYCSSCGFATLSCAAYKKHLLTHSAQTAVMQVCQVCGYTTASEYQFVRHKKKHRDERKFKCHLCDYKARHNMSLMYHLKTHDESTAKTPGKYYRCDRCKFKSTDRSKTLKHSQSCGARAFPCGQCSYSSKRRADLRRHQRTHWDK